MNLARVTIVMKFDRQHNIINEMALMLLDSSIVGQKVGKNISTSSKLPGQHNIEYHFYTWWNISIDSTYGITYFYFPFRLYLTNKLGSKIIRKRILFTLQIGMREIIRQKTGIKPCTYKFITPCNVTIFLFMQCSPHI